LIVEKERKVKERDMESEEEIKSEERKIEREK